MSLLLILLFAFFYAAFSATRGIDLDQMILYQSALKVLVGQILYQDFFIPHGPLGTVILAFFMRLFQTSGMGIVVASGLLNALATFSIWRIVKLNTQHILYPIFASILTAVWFLPVFGMFYYDHLAYCFALLAFLFFNERKTVFFTVLSALCFVLAFHTKQTVGAPALGAFFLSCFFVFGTHSIFQKRNSHFILTYCLGHLFIFSLIAFYSNFSNYFEYTFKLPLAFSIASEDKNIWNVFYTLIFPFRINPFQMLTSKGVGRLLFYPIVLAMYYGYWVTLKSQKQKNSRFALTYLILSTLMCTALLGRLFAHVFFGMGGIILLSLSETRKNRKFLASTVSILFILIGISYAHFLRPFRFIAEPAFMETDLSPIRIRPSALAQSSENIIHFIQKDPGNLVSLADATFLVPLALKQATLNPSVYYHDGLTIPLKVADRVEWERLNINVMESKKVKYLLMIDPIESGFRPVTNKIQDISPVTTLDQYVKENYHAVIKEPQFQLWQRN